MKILMLFALCFPLFAFAQTPNIPPEQEVAIQQHKLDQAECRLRASKVQVTVSHPGDVVAAQTAKAAVESQCMRAKQAERNAAAQRPLAR